MTTLQRTLTIAIVVLGTMITRLAPFLLLSSGNKQPPKVIRYLGKVLPAAVFGLLVIYCVKDVQLFSSSHGLPEMLGIVTVAALHLWKKNMMLSIAGGTVVYMLLVNLVF